MCVAPAPRPAPCVGPPREGAQSPPCCCRRPVGTWRPRWCASTGAATSPAVSSPWLTSMPVSPPACAAPALGGPALPFPGAFSRGRGGGCPYLDGTVPCTVQGSRPGLRPGGGPHRVGASGGGGLHLWVPAGVHACIPPIHSDLVAGASVQCRTWCCAQRGRGGVQGHWALPEPVPISLALPTASRC